MLFSTYSQSIINVVIIDDNDYPNGVLDIPLLNTTFCDHQGLIIRTRWTNSSYSLTDIIDQLEKNKNQTMVYLARTTEFSTKLIKDFCETNLIPFISMRSYGTLEPRFVFEFRRYTCYIIFLIRSSNYEYSVMPDILRLLVSYFKYHRIRRAAYIYNNNEGSHRIYELIKLMNNDEYFNDFSLNVRTAYNQDVYPLLYSVEIDSVNKEQPPKYILLDLETYSDYSKMFDKISHMGLYLN